MLEVSAVFRPRDVLRAAAAACFIGSAAFAQTPQFDLNQLELNSAANGTTVVGTGELLQPGTLKAALALSYDDSPVVYFDPNGDFVGEVISGRFTLHAVGAWAPFDWLEFNADIPIIASQEGFDLTEYGIPRAERTGIGNPVVTARLGLSSERSGAPLDVAAQVAARLPMGARGQWLADQRLVIAPKLMLGKTLGWIRAGAELGIRWNPDAAREQNNVQIAAVAQSGSRDGLRVELSGRSTVNFAGQRTPADVFLGARYPFGGLEVFALAGPYFQRGLRQGVIDWVEGRGAPPFRVMMGVTFGSGSGVASTNQEQEQNPMMPSPGVQPAYTDASQPAPAPQPAPGPSQSDSAPAAQSASAAAPASTAPVAATASTTTAGPTAAPATGTAAAGGTTVPASSSISHVTVPAAGGAQITVPVPAGYTLVPVQPAPAPAATPAPKK